MLWGVGRKTKRKNTWGRAVRKASDRKGWHFAVSRLARKCWCWWKSLIKWFTIYYFQVLNIVPGEKDKSLKPIGLLEKRKAEDVEHFNDLKKVSTWSLLHTFSNSNINLFRINRLNWRQKRWRPKGLVSPMNDITKHLITLKMVKNFGCHSILCIFKTDIVVL